MSFYFTPSCFLCFLLLTSSSVESQQSSNIAVGPPQGRPFCPLERPDNFQCRSRSNSYKCAALFEGLSGVDSPVSWIGAMPDALSKTSVQRNKAFISSFGLPVTRKSFLLGNRCSELTANSRCYAIMVKASKTPLDSCDESILNELGGRTVGDALCEKAGFHSNGAEQFNIKIGFYFSACGGGWNATVDNLLEPEIAQPLRVEEPLCCLRQGDRLKYYRCNGQSYIAACSNSTLGA